VGHLLAGKLQLEDRGPQDEFHCFAT